MVSGRIRLQQQAVDLNQVVRHALETAQPLVEQRRHELLVNVGSEPVWASADATRLEEVFVNLLDNAAKYTDPEGRIEVWCEHPGGQNHAQVRVRDNGVGIDEKLLPQIFDLFTQADRSLDRAAGGLGIGLSLAQRLVALARRLDRSAQPAGRPIPRQRVCGPIAAAPHAGATYTTNAGGRTAQAGRGARASGR